MSSSVQNYHVDRSGFYREHHGRTFRPIEIVDGTIVIDCPVLAAKREAMRTETDRRNGVKRLTVSSMWNRTVR